MWANDSMVFTLEICSKGHFPHVALETKSTNMQEKIISELFFFSFQVNEVQVQGMEHMEIIGLVTQSRVVVLHITQGELM